MDFLGVVIWWETGVGLTHSSFSRRSPLGRVGGKGWGRASTIANSDLIRKHSKANMEERNIRSIWVVVLGCLVYAELFLI